MASINDKTNLHPWTAMPCASSSSNVLVCGGVSRSDCEIYDPRSMVEPISNVYMYDITRSMIRQILDVSTQSSDVTRNGQAVVTASSNSNYAVLILHGQEFCPQTKFAWVRQIRDSHQEKTYIDLFSSEFSLSFSDSSDDGCLLPFPCSNWNSSLVPPAAT